MKFALTTAALVLAAAAASSASAQQCFRPHDIQGFTTAPDNRTVYFRASGRVFELRTANECPELANRNYIQLNPAGTSSTICSPIEADLRVRTAGISVTCPVDSLRQLSRAEVASLPRRLRP